MNKIDSHYLSKLMVSPLMEGLSKEQCRIACDEIDPRVARYRREEIVINEGESQKKFYLCVSGSIRCEKFYREGNVHIVDVQDEGDFIGIDTANSTTGTAPFTLIASIETELMIISMKRVTECGCSDILMRNMMRILANDNIKKAYKIDMISRPGTRDRIKAFLAVKYQKTGSKSFDIHMTQEQLAHFLCLNRSSLSHELNLMRREGLIDFYNGRYTILY